MHELRRKIFVTSKVKVFLSSSNFQTEPFKNIKKKKLLQDIYIFSVPRKITKLPLQRIEHVLFPRFFIFFLQFQKSYYSLIYSYQTKCI